MRLCEASEQLSSSLCGSCTSVEVCTAICSSVCTLDSATSRASRRSSSSAVSMNCVKKSPCSSRKKRRRLRRCERRPRASRMRSSARELSSYASWIAIDRLLSATSKLNSSRLTFGSAGGANVVPLAAICTADVEEEADDLFPNSALVLWIAALKATISPAQSRTTLKYLPAVSAFTANARRIVGTCSSHKV